VSAGTTFSFGGAGAPLLPVPFDKRDNKALNFYSSHSGTFVAPTNGTYVFQTRSDDGSTLWIDDQLVVYNDRFQGAINRSGSIDLTAGEHAIRILYVQGTGGLELSALVSGANIPNSMLKMTDEISIGDLSGAAGSILSLTGNVPVRIVQTSTQTFAGTVIGAGPMVKDGAGTLELTAASPFAGTVSVTAGALRVNGSLGAAGLITVHDGATLEGSGTVGDVAVADGGSLAPGSSPGMLTVGGDLALDSGSTLAIEINGTVAGTGHDQIYLSDSLATLTLNDPTLSISLGFTPSMSDVFTIVTGFGTLAGTGTFNGLTDGAQFVVNTTTFEIDYDTTDITLTVVPEPGALGTMGLLVAAALLRRRRR